MNMQERLARALVQDAPLEALYEEARKLRAEGIPASEITAVLEGMRRSVAEKEEDVILEVMDFLAGWGDSGSRLS